MDRGKNLPAKGSKAKPLGFSGDYIALGSKQSRSELVDIKTKSSTSSSVAGVTPIPISLATGIII